VFTEFLYELRERGLRVGSHEAMSLARAVSLGLHGSRLDGFYAVARALCVHREQDLDGFDRAFAHHFRGVTDDALALTEEMLEWLEHPKPGRELSDEEKQVLDSLDLEEMRKLLRERLAEQRERHDGGSKWIGTGGASPFGRGGKGAQGLRVGEGPRGGRGALAMAQDRRFKDLRSDVTLDTRRSALPCARYGPSRAPAPRTNWTSTGPSTPPRRTRANWRSSCARRANRTCG